MSLRRLTERTITLRIELDGETVDVRCRPLSAVQAARAVTAMDEAGGSTTAVADCLIEALSGVVVDDDDRSALPDLPLGVLSAMFGALTEGAADQGKFSITRA